MKITNPYDEVDFTNLLQMPAISHEHIEDQLHLESAYNRGIRIFAPSCYQPAVPFTPLSNINSVYEDYTSYNDLRIEVKTKCSNPPFLFEDFIDIDGNRVSLNSLIQLPNSEKVNIKEFDIMVHSNYLGSNYGDPGWSSIDGLPTDETVNWRSANKFIGTTDLKNGILNNLKYPNVLFGTLNHPQEDQITSIDKFLQFINEINSEKPIIKAIEIFNQCYTDETNDQFKNLYDSFLSTGQKLFCTAAVDWQDTICCSVKRNRGCNILLFDKNYYNTLNSMDDKAIYALNQFNKGAYCPSGLGSIQITHFSVRNNEIKLKVLPNATTSDNCSCAFKIKVITNCRCETFTDTNEVTIIIGSDMTYCRFEVYLDDDFLYTNPVFIEQEN